MAQAQIPTPSKIKNWIPKKHLPKIECVEQDSEVSEVVLKSGYSSVDGETIWVYGHHRFESSQSNQKTMREDLIYWLNQSTR